MSMYICPICGSPEKHGAVLKEGYNYRNHLINHSHHDLVDSYIKIHTKMIELETENRWLREDVSELRNKLEKIRSITFINDNI